MKHKLSVFMQKALIAAVRLPCYVFVRLKINYHRRRAPMLPEPFIILSNHNTDFDPVLVNAALRQHTYVVASEHIFRRGLASWLMKKSLNPIARPKGTTATGTVIEILKRIRTGQNILIFAEGNKSYNGLTNPILPSTGKLIKKAHCTLVTFRLNGGYFTSPRWAKNQVRRGRVDGGVVNVYSPEQVDAMSLEELNRVIAADIHEDAYAYQAEHKRAFRGKQLAEGIETALFLCPNCKKMAGLRSEGNRFFCECGLKGEYDRFGNIHGNFPYTTVRDWDLWELDTFLNNLNTDSEDVIFSEPDLKLMRVQKGEGEEEIDRGTLSITPKHMQLGNTVIPIEDIEDISIHGCSSIIMTAKKLGYLEIPSDERKFLGRIFLLAVEELKRRTAEADAAL